MKNYTSLLDFVNDNGGIDNFRFFTELEVYEPIGFGLDCSSGKFKLMECRIEDSDDYMDSHRLTKGHDYKCVVMPVDERYRTSSRSFYCNDLLSEFRRGSAIIKKDGYHILENVKMTRPFAGTPLLEEFYGDFLVDADNNIILGWSEEN